MSGISATYFTLRDLCIDTNFRAAIHLPLGHLAYPREVQRTIAGMPKSVSVQFPDRAAYHEAVRTHCSIIAPNFSLRDMAIADSISKPDKYLPHSSW